MSPIKLYEIKKGMVVLEEDSYGNNVFLAISDFYYDKEDGFPCFDAKDVKTDQVTKIGGREGYEPELFLLVE